MGTSDIYRDRLTKIFEKVDPKQKAAIDIILQNTHTHPIHTSYLLICGKYGIRPEKEYRSGIISLDSVEDVCKFFNEKGMKQYDRMIRDHELTGKALYKLKTMDKKLRWEIVKEGMQMKVG